MRPLRHLPIKRKLTTIMMLTSGAALLLACVSIVAYEQFAFRRTMIRDLTILADMYDDNVASGLIFNSTSDMEKTLKTLFSISCRRRTTMLRKRKKA